MTLLPLIFPSINFKSYPDLLLTATCLLLFYLTRTLLLSYLTTPLTRFPLFGHLPHLPLHFHDLHDFLTDVLHRTGCSYIFAGPAGTRRDILLTCDPANVNHVFNSNFTNFPKGGHFADLLDFLGGGIFNSDGESWKFQRKKAHSLMSTPSFRAFVASATRDKSEGRLVLLLDEFASSGEVLDLQDVFMRLSFDVTCKLVFGLDPGCLDVGFPRVPFADAMDAAEEVVFLRHVLPMTWWKVMRWMGVGPERRMTEAVEVLDRFIGRYVERRREDKSEGGADLLSAYLESQQEIGEAGFLDFEKFMRDTTLNLMVAGRDTVSSALTWFFYLVAKNPSIEAKILEELRQQQDTQLDLSKLVYLHAALCESLRLYPPVPFEHKAAVKPDRLPSGIEVDENRMVLFSLYSMGRMEGVWGKDCMEFRPERWISEETGKVRHEPSYKFFAFNAGPRTCLGRDIAFTQLKVVAAAMITRFRIRVVEGFVARPKLSIILHMKGGLMVSVSRRGDSTD